MKLLDFLEAIEETEPDVEETVGSNAGEQNSEDEKPLPPPKHGSEEGNASWDWTDPYHSSGEENAVMSRTP